MPKVQFFKVGCVFCNPYFYYPKQIINLLWQVLQIPTSGGLFSFLILHS